MKKTVKPTKTAAERMAELEAFPGFDPESTSLMSGYRVGLVPPAPNSLVAGEKYIEMTLDGIVRQWVGTPRPAEVPGNMVMMATSEAITQPPIDPGPEPAPPEVVDTPAVTVNGAVAATCNVGDTLEVTNGNWNGEPTSYWESWVKDSALIANGPTYVVQDVDAGATIECHVTATNDLGSTNAVSNAVTVNAAARSKGAK
jgi:hypothetical protein